MKKEEYDDVTSLVVENIVSCQTHTRFQLIPFFLFV